MAHIHRHDTPRTKAAYAYLLATLLGIVAFIVQIYGGHGSHSSGLIADSFHVAADAYFNLMSVVALFALKHREHPGRLPGLALMVVGAVAISMGVGRLNEPRIDDAWLMLVTSVIGLALNMAMLGTLGLAKSVHAHAHGHAHHEANVKHVVADLLSSIAVVVTAGMFLLFSGNQNILYADPILAAAIGFWLMVQGLHMFRTC